MRSTSVWLFACLGLAAVVVLELTGELPVASEVTAAAPSRVDLEPMAEPEGFEPPAAGQIQVIAARPLFAASRRPFVAPVVKSDAVETVETPVVTLELIGVMVTEQQRSVLVRPVGADKSSWIREGETIAGWRVEAVTSDQVTIQRDDQVETVALRADTSVPPAPKARKRKAKRELADKVEEVAADEPSDETEAASGSERTN